MKEMDITEIKQTELEILEYFAHKCEKTGLKYMLCGGTLLGAIRHQGFIPWDDDIDVLMPRGDFEKLLRISRKQKGDERYRLISWKTKDSPYPFIKMVDTTTVVKEEYVDPKYRINVWIDIFPFDGMPADDKLIVKKFKKLFFYKWLLLLAGSEAGKGTTWYWQIIKSIAVPFAKLLNISRIADKMNVIASEYPVETSPYLGGFLWGYGLKEKMPRTLLDVEDVTFEGKTFKAPVCWDEYLKGLYGDYMQLPPEEQRVHHVFKAWKLEAGDTESEVKRVLK